MRVDFSERATADLLDILTYIATDNEPAALAVVDEIEKFCFQTLRQNPNIGSRFKDTNILNVRRFPKRTYNIFYRVKADQIEILRVLHHARLASLRIPGTSAR